MKYFKLFLALFAAWLMVGANAWGDTFTAPATLVASNGSSQNIDMKFMKLTDQEGNRTVQVGEYYYASISTGSAGKVIIPSSVVDPGTEIVYTVTALGSNSFLQCSKITQVVIPETVTIIGDYSFKECTLLQKAELPSGVTGMGRYVFRDCKALTYTNFPAGLTSIPESSFMGCSSLASVTIPSTITSIDQWAFRDCSNLSSVTIPESVTSIGTWAFSGCSSLTDVTIPNVTTLGNGVFGECTSLQSVTISGDLTTLSGTMFENCTSLSSVTLPESLTTIEYEAFKGCTSLATFAIPSQVTTIGNSAFMGSGITSVTIPSGMTWIKNEVFKDCESLTSVVLPNTLTVIGDYAFQNCSALTTVNIPSSLTSVGPCAFSGCSNLSGDLVFPETTTKISFDAFYNCSSLSSVTIPAGVKNLWRPFQGCTGLTDVYFFITDFRTTALTEYSTSYPLFGQSAPDNVKIHVSSTIYQAFQQKLTSWYFYTDQSSATDPCEKLVVDGGPVQVGDEGLAKIVCKDLTTGSEKNVYAAHVIFTKVDGERTAIIYRPKVGTTFSSSDDFNTNACWYDGHTAIERVTSTYYSNMSLTLPSHVEDYQGNVYTVVGIGAYAASTAGDAAFSGSGVEEIRIPKTYTHIGRYALRNFYELKGKVVIPSSVKQLGHPEYNYYAGIFSDALSSQYGRVSALYFLHRDAEDIAWYDGSSSGSGKGYFLYNNNYNNIVYLYTCAAIKDRFATTSGNGFYAWDQYSFHRVSSFYPEYCAAIGGSLKAYEAGTYEITVSNQFDLPLKKEYFTSSDEEVAEIVDYIVTTGSNGTKYYNLKLSVSDKGGDAVITFNYPGDDVFDAMTSSTTVTRVPGTFIADVDGYDIVFRILTEDANGGTVQIGERLYSNTNPLGEDESTPSVFEKGNNPSTFTIPSTVSYHGKDYTVTAIGAYALSIFTEGDIELPSTITTIGYNAFNSSCWPNNIYCNSTNPPSFIYNNIPFQHYVDDETGEVDYSWKSEEGAVLYVPEGCVDNYSSWSDYFKAISGPVQKIVINGVEYKEEADLFNDGTAVLTWEYESSSGSSPKKSLQKVSSKSVDDDGRVPVLTLNGANISSDEGPAIEVNTYPRFYIRVQSGQNTITAANSQAAVSIGTGKGVDLTATSLIILNDNDAEVGGGEVIKAPRLTTQSVDDESTGQPSLTITNNTVGGDGVYVYQGSFNVQDCDVNITGKQYGLEFGTSETGSGTEEPIKAPLSEATKGPRKVIAVDGPVDASDYFGWMNIYEGSELSLNGDVAALWGGIGSSEGNNTYSPGYLQEVVLIDSDRSMYEGNPSYSAIEGPLFIPVGMGDFNGSYYIGCMKGDNSYDIFTCKYLKFGSDLFTVDIADGLPMTFKMMGENRVMTYGYWDNNNYYAVTAIPSNYSGSLIIPETVTYGGVTYTVTAIGEESFDAYNLSLALTEVTLPSTITYIGEYSFDCSTITKMTVYATTPPELANSPLSLAGNAVLYVPTGCVEAYEASAWVNYFSDILEIGNEIVIFTENVNGIDMTFKITGENTVQTYGYWAGSNAVTAVPSDFSGHLTIPETVEHEGVVYTVTAIGEESFDADGLPLNITGVTIPSTVTEIGEYAFWGNSAITELVIPNSVQVISWASFASCESLGSLTIGNGVSTIENSSFSGCSALTSVYVKMENPLNLPVSTWTSSDGVTNYEYVFDPLDADQTRILYVPAGSKNAYMESDWWTQGAFSEIVEEGDAPIVPADINGDGVVTIADVTSLVNIILGKGEQNPAADINGDGVVTIADVTSLVNIILGKN